MSEPVSKAYDETAGAYEKRWHRYLAHTHEKFLSQLETGPGDLVLDLSCGTGLLARLLVERGFDFDHLVLNDISEEMLSLAKQRLAGTSDITFTGFKASDLQFENRSFTKIICLNSFHHYSDHAAAIKECRRVLRPGGDFHILDWNNSGLFRPVNFIISRNTDELINSCSLEEAVDVFRKRTFAVGDVHEWYWFYWKFFSFKAHRAV